MESIAGLLPFILIIVVFYFLLIRPQRNRQREMVRMQQSLSLGQEVLTTSGLYASVVALDQDSVTLQTAPGVTSRWSRAAVGRILTPAGEVEEPTHDDLDLTTDDVLDRTDERSPEQPPDRRGDGSGGATSA